jgi:hypothetical protein
VSLLTAGYAGVLPHPIDLDPNMTAAWVGTVLGLLGTMAALVYAVHDWRRTRSPLLGLLLLGGATVGPFAIEPTYDIVLATWYPPELPLQIVTVAGRSMPLIAALMYVSIISTVCR